MAGCRLAWQPLRSNTPDCAKTCWQDLAVSSTPCCFQHSARSTTPILSKMHVRDWPKVLSKAASANKSCEADLGLLGVDAHCYGSIVHVHISNATSHGFLKYCQGPLCLPSLLPGRHAAGHRELVVRMPSFSPSLHWEGSDQYPSMFWLLAWAEQSLTAARFASTATHRRFDNI